MGQAPATMCMHLCLGCWGNPAMLMWPQSRPLVTPLPFRLPQTNNPSLRLHTRERSHGPATHRHTQPPTRHGDPYTAQPSHTQRETVTESHRKPSHTHSHDPSLRSTASPDTHSPATHTVPCQPMRLPGSDWRGEVRRGEARLLACAAPSKSVIHRRPFEY